MGWILVMIRALCKKAKFNNTSAYPDSFRSPTLSKSNNNNNLFPLVLDITMSQKSSHRLNAIFRREVV